jgi:hypothetical protein
MFLGPLKATVCDFGFVSLIDQIFISFDTAFNPISLGLTEFYGILFSFVLDYDAESSCIR